MPSKKTLRFTACQGLGIESTSGTDIVPVHYQKSALSAPPSSGPLCPLEAARRGLRYGRRNVRNKLLDFLLDYAAEHPTLFRKR